MRTWESDGSGIAFFERRDRWRRALRAKFPRAIVRSERVGRRCIDRAYVGRYKVGAFGRLRGFGYLSTEHIADVLHGHSALLAAA